MQILPLRNSPDAHDRHYAALGPVQVAHKELQIDRTMTKSLRDQDWTTTELEIVEPIEEKFTDKPSLE